MPNTVLTEQEADAFTEVALLCDDLGEREAARAVRRVRDFYDGSGVGQRRAEIWNRFLWRGIGVDR